jgi:hypothetical protein
VPGLVGELLVASAEESPARLLRLDRERRTLEPATWPADLEPFRRFLERQASGEADWRDADGPGPTTLTLYGMLSSPPAVVLPLLSAAVPERKRGAPEPPLLRACSIVRLDSDVLIGRWLPALATRHFAPSDYDLAVRSGGEGGAIVYARAAQSPEAVLRAPDGRIRLMTLAFDEIGWRPHEPGPRPVHVDTLRPGERPASC